jgi:hypothetical protein
MSYTPSSASPHLCAPIERNLEARLGFLRKYSGGVFELSLTGIEGLGLNKIGLFNIGGSSN